MGLMMSNIARRDDRQVSDTTNPQQPDWITAHATTTGLSIVEVERLWLRFQQLGCSPDGVLTDAQIKSRGTVMADNAFLRNILTKLKTSTTSDGVVTFQAFINTMYWTEVASLDEKIRATFHLMNNGRPLSENLIRQVLTRVYPNETEQGLDRFSKALFETMGEPGEDGEMVIKEESFMAFTRRVVPPHVLENVFKFSIVPPKVSAEAKALLEQENTMLGKRSDASRASTMGPGDHRQGPAARKGLRVEMSYQIPTSGQLDQIAEHIYRRDFRLVGNKLGFFESDMNHMENMYPGDRRQQVNFMLHEWRKREGARAYTIVLQRALQESNMSDIASMLQPNPTHNKKSDGAATRR